MKYKNYQNYKETGIEWLVKIPEHWLTIRLKFLSKKITKGTTPMTLGKEFVDEGIPFIKVENISDQMSIIFDDCNYIDIETDNLLQRSKLKENDVIISIAGAIGRVALVKKEHIPSNTNQAVGIITLKINTVNPKWIAYNLVTNHNQKYYTLLTVKSAQANLSLEDVGEAIIYLPPIKEQQKITLFLDKKIKKINHLIEMAQDQIELLQEKRNALIIQAVTKGIDLNVKMKDSGIEWLREVPQHWEVKRLKYVLTLITEKIKNNEQKDKIGLENIESWTGKFIKTDSLFEGEGINFKTNDILFGKLRPYLAKVFLSKSSGKAVGDFFVYRCIKDVIPKFAFYRLISKSYIDVINGSTYGAKMPRANSDFIGNLPFFYPTTNEQKDIISFIDSKIQIIDNLNNKIDESLIKLKEYRQSLISSAVTGQIDIRKEVA